MLAVLQAKELLKFITNLDFLGTQFDKFYVAGIYLLRN